MTTRFLSAVILLLSFTTITRAQTDKVSNAHIGFIFPLSTNGIDAAEYTNKFSVHALVGVSKNEKSFCAAGFGNIIKDSAKGFVAAGYFNYIGESASGVQASGYINYIRHEADGLQAAGFINISGSARGAQLAGFGNFVTRGSSDLQVAGFINHSKNTNSQVSGFINIADSVEGTQIAGFMNVAGKVKGVQISGFINIADSSDYPIGLINIIKKGQKAIGISVDESGTTIAAFRSGGRVLYGIVGVGFNFNYNNSLYALQTGLGAHLPLTKHITLSGEATVTSLTDLFWDSYLTTSIRFMPSVKIGHFETFAGPSINFSTSGYGIDRGPFHTMLWHENSYYGSPDVSIGFLAGVQWHL